MGTWLLWIVLHRSRKIDRALQQIWFQPYPAGKPVKISNDLSQYQSLSVTADGRSFVITQSRPSAAIYVADSPAVLNSKGSCYNLAPLSLQLTFQEQINDADFIGCARVLRGYGRLGAQEDIPSVAEASKARQIGVARHRGRQIRMEPSPVPGAREGQR